MNRYVSYEYNHANQLTKVVDPAGTGVDVLYEYNALGFVTKVTDPNETVTTVGYDYNGRPDSVSSGGNDISVVYDEIGNVVSVTDDASHTTGYTYDYNNQLSLVTDADSNNLKYVYDTIGRLTKSGGGVGATVAPTTSVLPQRRRWRRISGTTRPRTSACWCRSAWTRSCLAALEWGDGSAAIWSSHRPTWLHAVTPRARRGAVDS